MAWMRGRGKRENGTLKSRKKEGQNRRCHGDPTEGRGTKAKRRVEGGGREDEALPLALCKRCRPEGELRGLERFCLLAFGRPAKELHAQLAFALRRRTCTSWQRAAPSRLGWRVWLASCDNGLPRTSYPNAAAYKRRRGQSRQPKAVLVAPGA
ncbi:hypothetical protein BD289DRAFT_139584 [Coniella lustricola]|uniref:Uncharacterized protein n=1 Tax=Coniella lustricola TaxID=2025994 RepID=A0A2T3AF61_9PEZI|nr:hypothetical protein BD289DRAFT_139584 [Coniella lustricola]